ncbi:MAG: methyltransferase [Clostridia bacterium]|nr:methyltransferase [Clostridia bacterium]
MIKNDERIDIVNEDIKLIQKKDGLTFGTDALLLAAFVKAKPSATALDFGAGTGIISFLCAVRNKFKKVVAIEAQSDFAEMIERNIELNNLSDKVCSKCIDVRQLNFDKLGFEADVIFTNPPYMRAGSGKHNSFDCKTIARHEILGDIADFCSAAAKNLKHGGYFYTVYRPERMTELFYAMKAAKIEPKRLCLVCPDSESSPSLILVEGKKGASAEIKIEKPLYLYKDKSHKVYTDDLAYIYENGCFKEDVK